MINNLAIIILFIATSKSLAQKSQRGIALNIIIEIVDKELLKYEVESIIQKYMIDEHGKEITFLSLGEIGPFLEKRVPL